MPLVPTKRPKAAFYKCGGFSHINRRVEEQLRLHLPEFDFDVIDLKGCALAWHSIARHGWRVPAAYGLKKLWLRRDPVDALIQSPGIYRFLKRFVCAETRRGAYQFTIQTQSMFDASAPTIPHFVYTDHTELTNVKYPAFDRRKLMDSWWIELERQIYHNAHKVFTMSSHVTQSLLEDYGCSPASVECIYAGSNSRISAASSPNPSTPIILFVGVDWQRKGGPQLVEAFEHVIQKHPGARLRIVGCSPTITTHGCEIVGRIPLEQMRPIYEQATIFCMPTRIEPFGIAFVEAMHAGLPVVATDIGAVPDLVTNGVNGFRVPVDDVGALASALDQVLANPELARRMGAASREIARERYSWDAVGGRLASSIRSCLEKSLSEAGRK